jgi:xanthine dehydrogenase accessory factor
MRVWTHITDALRTHGRCAMVTIAATDGSVPRETGARMIVLPTGGFHGTIGGGTLEWRALAEAQRALHTGQIRARWIRQTLGPELGQCCGGRVTLLLEVIDSRSMVQAQDFAALEAGGGFSSSVEVVDGHAFRERLEPNGASPEPTHISADGALIEFFGEIRRPVLLFGAGHVGRALVMAMAPLPLQVTWVDPRPESFPAYLPANTYTVASAAPVGELAVAPAASFVLIMSHSHSLDLEITHAALADGRFPYVGLIGSGTKRARFVKRLREAGLPEERIATLVCPIGIPGIGGKLPAVIAAATAAELLLRDESLRAQAAPAGILGQTA